MQPWLHSSLYWHFQHQHKTQICINRPIRKRPARAQKRRCRYRPPINYCNWQGSFWIPSGIDSEHVIFQAHTPLRSVIVSIKNNSPYELYVVFYHDTTGSSYKTMIMGGGTLNYNAPTLHSIRVTCSNPTMSYSCTGTYHMLFKTS